ncbi:hypothetical protein RND71_023548 [Anisodus tanguticus]|uniref:Proteasome assembly chaperone 1 n=1 Tax=Anisodus tanguticus TaxID=243964 RepID=A0AAE1V663_9SOLA|nr:hypothetical protein RND71_023548 [Anisodus tanguticus]
MEDIVTEIPPPSRFFLEELNNFVFHLPPFPSPFLLFSTPNQKKYSSPSLLIIAMSSPSLQVFHHVSSKTLVGTLILPEIPLSGNSVEPSLKDKSCNIYALNEDDNLIMSVSVQYPVTAERSHAIAKLLIGEQIIPEKVLILASIRSSNFRGRLSPDEAIAFKLESSAERKAKADGHQDSPLVKCADYLPSGSVVDGLAAALLSRCQLKKIRGTLCVSWPEVGASVISLVKCLLLKDVLSRVKHVDIKNLEEEFLKLGRSKDFLLDSELYT